VFEGFSFLPEELLSSILSHISSGITKEIEKRLHKFAVFENLLSLEIIKSHLKFFTFLE
jgi:hypothetical protein